MWIYLYFQNKSMINMIFNFKQLTNQNSIHNDESIQYFSNLAFNSNENILLDIIIDTLQLDNEEYRRQYLFEIKEYYHNKGVVFDDIEFEHQVDNFLSNNIGNVKGAFLEVLIYKLIQSYCNHDGLYKECIISNYNNHPYDIVTVINDIVHLIDIKFSCHHLKKIHLDYLLEYVNENNFKSYLLSLDSFSKINDKLHYIQYENNISDNDFHFIMTNITFISNSDIYDSIMNQKCLVN